MATYYYYPKSLSTTTIDVYNTFDQGTNYYKTAPSNTSSINKKEPPQKKEEKVLFDVNNLDIGA